MAMNTQSIIVCFSADGQEPNHVTLNTLTYEELSQRVTELLGRSNFTLKLKDETDISSNAAVEEMFQSSPVAFLRVVPKPVIVDKEIGRRTREERAQAKEERLKLKDEKKQLREQQKQERNNQFAEKKADRKDKKQKLEREDFEQSLATLLSEGFDIENQNFRLLRKFNGDLNEVRKVLIENKSKREAKQLERTDAKKNNMQVEKSIDSEWPINVDSLFLDGNNMLYVVQHIRSLVLKRKNQVAERLLADIAYRFAQLKNVPHTTVLFDNTKLQQSEPGFLIKSSRPEFATSDDELVKMAASCGPNSIFVTSDRELRERLTALGVTLMKPKAWFAHAANALGSEYDAMLNRESN